MIVLLGATGVTGLLATAELRKLDCAVRLVGRDADKLQKLHDETGFETRVVDLASSESIANAIGGAKVVINCIGPFSDHGDVVVQEVVKAKAHYIDTTGEQVFISAIFQKYGEAAKENGITLAPACAFEYAIADTAATLATRGFQDTDSIDLVYKMKGSATSIGTRKSLYNQLRETWFRLKDRKLQKIDPIEITHMTPLADKKRYRVLEFPGGEALLLPLHISVRNVRSYMVLPSKLFKIDLKIPSGIVRGFASAPITGDFLGLALTSKGSPTKEEIQTNFGTVICKAYSGDLSQTVVAEVRDPYALTALIVAKVAETLEKNGTKATGPCAPSMIAGADYIVEVTSELANWIREPALQLQ
jgi:hypothetical protein